MYLLARTCEGKHPPYVADSVLTTDYVLSIDAASAYFGTEIVGTFVVQAVRDVRAR